MTDTAPTSSPRYPVRLVALRTGLSPHVLRAWERRYGVVVPTRTEGGQRLYSDLDIARLLRLRRLSERGHAIGRIASLSLAELIRLEEQTPAVSADPATEEADGIAAAALLAVQRLDAVELQAVLERAAVTLGVPAFLDHVVSPFLERVGQEWSRGTVSVAQEHMASAVVRRVLGWLLRVYEVRNGAPRLVVATPPHHAHELGALMAAATAAAEGWIVTYLGPDLPIPDLVSAVGLSGARAVAFSAVHRPDTADLVGALRDARARLPDDVQVLVGGAEALRIRDEVEATGARVVASLAELRALLPRLAEDGSA